ncbi:class I SAM-dependent methyltransferase [Vibrio sp. S4M6]|uniref:class I SAM-dependent methyltransferase n=1 Tax=Vibrio sinus TaxID=2946865 RepID=UPI00202A28C4|nr:class I SAM-dependent methyltransferase [Vibrio sinus]MCL9780030.1 class I SAM-dependent methyltransferase [Vibrio sinus]
MPIENQNVIEHNSLVWDGFAKEEGDWSKPVLKEVIEQAKLGNWAVHITKTPLKTSWLPKDIKGKNVLCLASAGGQQAPVLAAAGAKVTVYDISQEQLAKDEFVAQRDGLTLETIKGDMRDLFIFADQTFDYIISPISNLYISELKGLWQECYRVLKVNGVLLTSFYNPVLFVFDKDTSLAEQGILRPKYRLPYSDISSLGTEELQQKISKQEAIVFGHTLTEQIGLQTDAGFLIAGFYEDDHPSPRFLIEQFMSTMIATKAVKLCTPND